jgi:hypothetical protein
LYEEPFFLDFDRHRVEQTPHLLGEESFVFGDAIFCFINNREIVFRLFVWIVQADLFSDCPEVLGDLTIVLDNYRLVLSRGKLGFSQGLFLNVVLIDHDFGI